jgi:hypothetical protein
VALLLCWAFQQEEVDTSKDFFTYLNSLATD